MAELIHEYVTPLRTPDGLSYGVRPWNISRPEPGWLVGILPGACGRTNASDGSRNIAGEPRVFASWAEGLESTCLEGAFEHTRPVDER
jgi:hypothetical protein